jgi:hypothetical protein
MQTGQEARLTLSTCRSRKIRVLPRRQVHCGVVEYAAFGGTEIQYDERQAWPKGEARFAEGEVDRRLT